MSKRIVILTKQHPSANLYVNAIMQDFNVVGVIQEQPLSRMQLMKWRIKKQGIVNVFGQILFILFRVPMLEWYGKDRMKEILSGFSTSDIDASLVHNVSSINQKRVAELLQELKPTHVLVYGTRIIKKRILHATDAPFINVHAGITPQYRGGHGMYWALAHDDAEHAGVTVHFVDEGIDTGGVLAQKVLQATERDNFVTYPWLQLTEGIKLLKDVLNRDTLEPIQVTGESSDIWYHPTLWGYMWRRVSKGVK